MSQVPEIRIAACNATAVRNDGEFVLYWMIAFRRTHWNFSLQRAIEWAVELKKPLVIFEPLRIGYRWASDRLHRFVIDGMADNAARIAALKNRGVAYFPYVEGRIHNYLRMLWGKKILEWTATPRDALDVMIELNDRYALDGRDPNSYSGIFWVLGRYDRPWGPERPIFGTVRYMSSENTRKKIRVREYLSTYS